MSQRDVPRRRPIRERRAALAWLVAVTADRSRAELHPGAASTIVDPGRGLDHVVILAVTTWRRRRRPRSPHQNPAEEPRCRRRPVAGRRALRGRTWRSTAPTPRPPAPWSGRDLCRRLRDRHHAGRLGRRLDELRAQCPRTRALRDRLRLGRPRLDRSPGLVRSLQQGTGPRAPARHLRRRRRVGRLVRRTRPGDVRCRAYGSPRSAVHDPRHAPGPAGPDPPRRPGPHPRCGHPRPLGRQPAELAFPLARRPGQEGRPRPALPARHGRAVEDRLQGPARGRPRRPRRARVRADVQGAALGPVAGRQLRDGAAVPVPVQPVRPDRRLHLPRRLERHAGRPGRGRRQLPDRAAAVLPPDRDLRDPRRARPTRAGSSRAR